MRRFCAEMSPIPMSARRRNYWLAPRAKQDLKEILVYTERHWGKLQRGVYRDALRGGCETLGDNPRLGDAKNDLGAGLYSFPVEHHVLYYRINEDVVEIVRILHERMDPARHLP
jgi:toxin ParE1/3/4